MNNPILNSESFERAAYALRSSLDNFNGGNFAAAVERFERQVDRLARLMAMQAENNQRKVLGHSMAYDEGAFLNA
jgi:hypothetical protein